MGIGSLRLVALPIAAQFALTPASACTVSTTGVAFGNYDPLGAAPDDSVGTIRLECHPSDHEADVAIGAGLSGSFSPRQMSNGAARLNYNLYTNVGRTIVWGDGTGGSVVQTLTGGTVSAGVRRFTATVYARIPAGQNVAFGSYGDTLIATVTF